MSCTPLALQFNATISAFLAEQDFTTTPTLPFLTALDENEERCHHNSFCKITRESRSCGRECEWRRRGRERRGQRVQWKEASWHLAILCILRMQSLHVLDKSEFQITLYHKNFYEIFQNLPETFSAVFSNLSFWTWIRHKDCNQWLAASTVDVELCWVFTLPCYCLGSLIRSCVQMPGPRWMTGTSDAQRTPTFVLAKSVGSPVLPRHSPGASRLQMWLPRRAGAETGSEKDAE